MSDLKLAARSLGRSPGFAAVGILTLAVGIGANTALFSTFSALVLHPLSFPRPDELVRLWGTNPAIKLDAPTISWARYAFLRDHQRSFAQLSASAFTGFTVTRDDGPPEQVNAVAVTPGFFPTLGVAPARGRLFSAADEVPGGPRVALLGYEYWQRAFGGRESALGASIVLNGVPHTIIGIAPAGLGDPYRTVLLFVPRPFELVPPDQRMNGTPFVQATGRLGPGTDAVRAGEEMAVLTADYRRAFPNQLDAQTDTRLVPFADELVGRLRAALGLLLGAVLFVLLIACANVSALFLGRLAARQREIAVRRALGATPAHLLRLFLSESALVSAGAAPLGIFLGWWSLAGIRHLAAGQLPPGATLHLDGATLAFAGGLAVFSTLLVGLVPAGQAARNGDQAALHDGSRGSSGGVRCVRLRSGLVVAEVALSSVLLVLSGLLLVSFVRLQAAPAGFNPHGVATALVSLPAARYPTGAQQGQFFGRLVERLEANPRVDRAALAIGAPLTGFQPRAPYAVWGRPVPAVGQRELASLYRVTDHYFSTLRIPLRAGRGFDQRDDERVGNRCLINESFARRLFPGESALGKVLLRGPDAEVRCEIIGVTADVKSAGLTAAAPDEIYLSARQVPARLMVLLVRTGADPGALQSLIRSAVAELDPRQPIAEFATYDSLMADAVGAPRLAAGLAAVMAALALLLALVGLYSVLAHAVAQRTVEIGIRMALGARRGQIVALVMCGGLRPVLAGLVLGFAVAAACSRLVGTLLFAVRPVDPFVYGAVAVAFFGVAALACLLPSWRAARIDPLAALRGE